MHKNNPVICAIDSSDLRQAQGLVKAVSPHVGHVKLGLEFFTSCGAGGVKKIMATGVPVFLDLKFHDIPNTVMKATKAACELGVAMITVHASGGRDMLEAAVEAANGRTTVLAVTVLTSMNDKDLQEVGVKAKTDEQVLQLADIAVSSGVDGLVCSSHELEKLRKIYKNEIKLVVPGIRPEGSSKGDQKRIMTPSEALKKGADYLVIGRPITDSKDPGAAAKKIFNVL